MTKTVSATFKSLIDMREALTRLEMAGISSDQVSVAATDQSVGFNFNMEKDNKAAEGGVIGGATGGLLGAIAAGLAATGSIVIPGVNLLVYGSAIAAAAGAGVGATVGGLAGSLVGLGIPEYEAKRYEDEVKEGSALVVVEAEDDKQVDQIKEIFEFEHAQNIAA